MLTALVISNHVIILRITSILPPDDSDMVMSPLCLHLIWFNMRTFTWPVVLPFVKYSRENIQGVSGHFIGWLGHHPCCTKCTWGSRPQTKNRKDFSCLLGPPQKMTTTALQGIWWSKHPGLEHLPAKEWAEESNNIKQAIDVERNQRHSATIEKWSSSGSKPLDLAMQHR